MLSAMRKTSTVAAVVAAALLAAGASEGQTSSHPYRINPGWNKPIGRKVGVASGIKMDRDGRHMWILDRCGANGCAESDLDPIIRMDPDGKIVASFGKGLLNFPHGFFIDREGNVWVTDGAPVGDRRGEAGFKKGMGHQVWKFSADGKVLMTPRGSGRRRRGREALQRPNRRRRRGERGHLDYRRARRAAGRAEPENMYGSRGGNNRLVRFSKDGKFVRAWGGGVGSESSDPLRFNDPHDIAIDAEGRLYVADRGNQRVQVLDKEGNFITRWTQFGKPSAIAIDDKGQHLCRRRHVGRALESGLGARHPRRGPQDRLGQGLHPGHGDHGRRRRRIPRRRSEGDDLFRSEQPSGHRRPRAVPAAGLAK